MTAFRALRDLFATEDRSGPPADGHAEAEQLGARLQVERRARRWTQAELATKSGLTDRTIREVEGGGGSIGSLKAAFAAFGITLALPSPRITDSTHVRSVRGIKPFGVGIEGVDLRHGDALEVLTTLRDKSIHCIVTSPPYYGQKIYAGRPGLGNEASIDEYLDKLALIFSECFRVLRDDGSLWINVADTYVNKEPSVFPRVLSNDCELEGGCTGRKSSGCEDETPRRQRIGSVKRTSMCCGSSRNAAAIGLTTKACASPTPMADGSVLQNHSAARSKMR
jgi:transcriptional regulator with XRE-family HTH domain